MKYKFNKGQFMNALKLLLITSLFIPLSTYAKDLQIDPAHSSVTFVAKHLKISEIPGKFTSFTGSIDLNEKDLTKSKVNLEIDVSSINTAVDKRDQHLKSPDFFDAAKFPKASFVSTNIKKSGSSYVVTGNLKIRDLSKKVSFQMKKLGEVEDPMMKTKKYVFQASGKINRKDFGVNYGPDAIVGDIVSLDINLEGFVPAKK